MSSSPIRRAQLIAPFGVGAMVTGPDGTSTITGALDGWFDAEADGSDVDLDEFRITEWRLEHALRVNELRLPPDYRTHRGQGADRPKNLYLTVPTLRFPVWHFCPQCRAMHEVKPHHAGKRRCPSCEAKNAAQAGRPRKAPFLAQVPFVAMCENGHLEDFPWREWVHRDVASNCTRQLHLRASGGASLAAQMVHCECGVPPRNLAQITEASRDEDGNERTFLSANLSSTHDYLCRGLRPWMDDRIGEGCGRALRGTLRAATNVYFAHTESAIYIPPESSEGLPEGLMDLLDQPPLVNSIHFAQEFGVPLTADVLRRDRNSHLLDRFTDAELERALQAMEKRRAEVVEASPSGDDLDPQAIRRPEYVVLREELESEHLKVRPIDLSAEGRGLPRYFSRVNLVEQLRETRVLYGFSRVRPDGRATLNERKAMLWRNEPGFQRSWLPAYLVHGEGIYLEFDEQALNAWERRTAVVQRVSRLAASPEAARTHRGLADAAMMPRYVMLHTFAHLLINQLVFECGYSSASLRERIFCALGDTPMAGILIYTAAGDSEGTMGGLVRMGRPDNLEATIVAALDRARWCSSDPVCMELGERGQGPGSTNLAACHGCALLPETACEAFNRFLDRGLVAGTLTDASLGFTNSLA